VVKPIKHSFNFFLIEFDVSFTTVLAFPWDSMLHCSLLILGIPLFLATQETQYMGKSGGNSPEKNLIKPSPSDRQVTQLVLCVEEYLRCPCFPLNEAFVFKSYFFRCCIIVCGGISEMSQLPLK
jgi:hypothetical protein